MSHEFAKKLLQWYMAYHRPLPWRGQHDPYRIWVSEIMLQQTQVETVIPYYAQWLEKFPTLTALANATEHEVLALWEGLGYYSRARNLHRAAQQVVKEYAGQMPNTLAGLRELPGIGPYTAGAIASIAFGVDAAVLDGNVKRVLARVFDLTVDVKSPQGEKQLWALAESLVPPRQAGDYNQALMDLGATICTPRNPTCLLCPVQTLCRALALGVQNERPVTRPRAPVPQQVWVTGVIYKNNQVLIQQRPADTLLGGLWGFPSFVSEGATASGPRFLQRKVAQALRLEIKVQRPLLRLAHAFTHLQVDVPVFACEWQAGRLPARRSLKWVRPAELGAYPMGKIDRQIAKRLAET